MWGIFDTPDNLHVAPVGEDRRIVYPHTLDEFCLCDPEIEIVEGSDRLLVTHNEEN